ncbi:STAS domain-containing protein [Streptomyces sp. NPDC002886]|uniref:STAS domain-containing protein n=1 Tax=Streptomyces sp. NPDC002886 TaxID=3364667 RepID=UPI00367471D8
MHLTPVGELDLDTSPALTSVRAALGDGIAVVACDMHFLSFIDVVGLHRLLDLARHTQSRGSAFFAYNWQRQPQWLLDLVDDLDPAGQGRGSHTSPTSPLRRTLRAPRSVSPPRAAPLGDRAPHRYPQAAGG